MKISPVNLLSKKHSQIIVNNEPNIRYYQNYGSDSVKFSGYSKISAKDFKKLGSYTTCFYTGNPMLSGEQLTKLKKQGYFEGSIKDVVRRLKPYKEKYLAPIEREVFEQIEKTAKKNPDMDLTQLFKSTYENTRTKFREVQKPSFDAIKKLGKRLPKEYQKSFEIFMETVDKKLYDKPLKQDFSTKEFTYKVNNIAERSSDEYIKTNIKNLLELLNDPYFERNDKSLRPTLIKKVFKINNSTPQNNDYVKYYKSYETNKNAVKIAILKEISEIANQNGYKRLEKLCETSIDMVKGIPVTIPFNNKSFIYDLDKTLSGLPNQQLKEKMIKIAMQLPTSAENKDALMLKLRDSDPNIIGDRLFNPVLASIEHLVPSSMQGENNISNWVLALRYINSKRSNKTLSEFLKEKKKKNQQKYIDNLAKLVKQQRIPLEDALAQIKTIENEGKIKLNKSKFKELII